VKPRAVWQHRKRFGIQDEMKKVALLAIEASNAEIASIQHKIDKLTYGS
jgi:hypothetical protein